MKKILSFLLALTIVITSFASVGTTVSAAGENDIYKSYLLTGTIEDAVKAGRECKHFSRTADKNTFMSFYFHNDKVDSNKPIVISYDVVFGDSIVDMAVQPATKGATNPKFVLSSVEGIKAGDWNNIKIVYRNIASEKGFVYINDVKAHEFTMKATNVVSAASTESIRIPFSDASGADATVIEELWVDINSIKITNDFVFHFDSSSDTEFVASKFIAKVAADKGENAFEQVNGIYGRDVNDKSWYFKRSLDKNSKKAYPRVEVSIPYGYAFNQIADADDDLIIETSVLFENDTTVLRLDCKGGSSISTNRYDYVPNAWNKVVIVAHMDTDTADIYMNGEFVGTKACAADALLSNNSATYLRPTFIDWSEADDITDGYINNMTIYLAPKDTVTGIEAKGLTEASTLAAGYRVDFDKNVIYTTNDITGLTVDALKANLGIAEDVVVRAYADTDAKCETPVTNIADGYKVAVETSTGIIQLLTLRQVELDVNASGVATYTPAESVSGVLLVAAYDGNGKLIKIDNLPVSGSATLASTVEGAYKYKAFVFDSITSVKPLVESASSR